MKAFKLLVLALFLFIGFLDLQAQTPANRNAPAAPQTPKLTGKVTDPSGAVILGAEIKIYQGSTLVKEFKSDDRGSFSVDLAPGNYRVDVTAPDFKPFSAPLRMIPNLPSVTIPMVLAVVTTTVDVGAKTDTVSIDEDSSLTSTTISGEKLKELPDDEDALMQQLQAIAGGSGAAGANATFVVDGISGGRVPPKDQIQSVIIDTNVFSAEGMGGPRIQIITKPGTGPWSGNMNFMFNDESLNAKNPRNPIKPGAQQRTFNTNYGGPIIPGKLTMRFNARESQMEFEGSSTNAITPAGPVTASVFSPQKNRGLALNGQLFLTTNSTLNFGLNYGQNRARNQGVTDISLPERAFDSRFDNTNVNLSNRTIVGTRIIHESRFSFGRSTNSTYPKTDLPQINVLGAFFGGGSQNKNSSIRNNWAMGQTLRWTLTPKINLVSGMDLFFYQIHSTSEANYLGSFTFSSLDDFIAGRAVTFRKVSGDPKLDLSQLEMATFLQADIKLTPKLNLGAGMRYQAQTNFDDHNNLAPTLQLAYQVHPKTVLRAGGRLTYNPFSVFNVEQLRRFDGTSRQTETVILNPSYPDPFLSGTGTTSSTTGGSIRVKDAAIRAPSTVNSALTVEQTLPKSWRVSASFDLSRGMNLIRTRNINAPYPGTRLSDSLLLQLSSRDTAIQSAARAEVDRMRPFYPLVGNINSFESTGRSISKNLGLRVFTPGNLRAFNKVGINGFFNYTYGTSRDNLSAMNQYDWNSDWGYAGFDVRHRVFSNLSFALPKGTNAGFFVIAQSGNPYTVTTGRDENGDQSTSDRPAGYARNSERGPGRYNVDANFSKTFILKKNEQGNAAGAGVGGAPVPVMRPFVEPQIIMIGPGGAGGPIMMPPPPGMGGPVSSPGLRMTFNVQVANLLNNTQLRQYNGILTSPFFGKSNTAMDGRRVRLGLNFLF